MKLLYRCRRTPLWLIAALEAAAGWWRWHGPRRRVHELEAEVERQREEIALLIRTLVRVGEEAGWPAPPGKESSCETEPSPP